MPKRTPLFDAHRKLGGKMIEFGGWEMPVQYTSIVDEHLCVRKAAGLFDICHMGELLFSGPDASRFLNLALTNDINKLEIGQGQYSLMCNEQGGVVDDLYVYRVNRADYLLIVNASRIEADAAWLEKLYAAYPRKATFRMENASGKTGALALQGPKAAEFICECFPGPSVGCTPVGKVTDLKKNQLGQFVFKNIPFYVARTGYTGEDGFELVAPSGFIEAAWWKLLEAGKPFGLQPAGLGARDTLRTEMCYPLYGHELNEQTTPLEAGLGFFVSFDKGDFIGRQVLVEQKEKGVKKRCVPFRMIGAAPPPRPGYTIWSADGGGIRLGEVCSGTQSPSLNVGIGLGYVPAEFAAPGTKLEIEVRGRRFPAETTTKPFYRRPSVKQT
jgi:aminomethyltransferase